MSPITTILGMSNPERKKDLEGNEVLLESSEGHNTNRFNNCSLHHNSLRGTKALALCLEKLVNILTFLGSRNN